jgi:hypothetical protein
VPQVKIPAVSREMEFIATHTEEANDVWDGNVQKIDPAVEQLSKAVYVRANNDVAELLKQAEGVVDEGAKGHVRLNNWHGTGRDWYVYSEIYWGTRGRKKSIGWAGLQVGYGMQGFRLIGYMRPRRGGLDACKRLALACQKKIKGIHITGDHYKKYPGWPDSIIWFDKKLSLTTSLDELHRELKRRAQTFFRVVMPLLKAT